MQTQLTNRKQYRATENIGTARHVVSFHDGVKTHKDGSPFHDCRIFTSKRKRDAFTRDLRTRGYSPE